MKELAPCPFCGNSLDIDYMGIGEHEYYRPIGHKEECILNDLLPYWDTEKQLIRDWNTRAEPENQVTITEDEYDNLLADSALLEAVNVGSISLEKLKEDVQYRAESDTPNQETVQTFIEETDNSVLERFDTIDELCDDLEEPLEETDDSQVTCISCGYTGSKDTYIVSLSLYSDIRCPKCGSTDNEHNDDYRERLNTTMK